ncbi:hypothetical protein B0H14DRAFT_2630876 [Mycena olivaceomarginata]|nr:hypothetical protein B0H14DRAFT_2630876 [Mycena olivaceomarginata]
MLNARNTDYSSLRTVAVGSVLVSDAGVYYFLCPHPAPPIQVLSPISAHWLSLDISALDTDDARNCPAVVTCNRSTIPARESPPSALFTRVLTIYDNRWWRDENERKGGMSIAGSQRITTDDTLRDEVAGDGGRGDGSERVKTVSWGCSGTARATY